MRIFVVILLIAVVIAPGPVGAEHEADHRYTVEGYVLAPDQNPLAGVPVVIRLGTDRSARGITDKSGHYSLRLHVHNAELGKRIRISAGRHKAEIVITFDPANATSPRIHYANFIGESLSETRIKGRIGQWNYIIWIGVGLIAIGAAGWGYRMRKRYQKRQRRKKAKSGKAGTTRRRKRKR